MLAALLKGEMQPSTTASNEDEMAPINTGPTVRQYSNRRSRKSTNDGGKRATLASSKPVNQEKEKSSVSSISSNVQEKESNTRAESEAGKKKCGKHYPATNPQIIVRKFTLPAPQSSSGNYNLVLQTSNGLDFQKPKQRWKQLCNLTQEMTTTLPVTKVKMLNPSTTLTREFRPGNLTSNGNNLDVDINALQKILANKAIESHSEDLHVGKVTPMSRMSRTSTSPTAPYKPILPNISSVKNILNYSPPFKTTSKYHYSTDRLVDVPPVKRKTNISEKRDSHGNKLEEISDCVQTEVPEVAATAEVVTDQTSPLESSRNNFGIPAGKYVIVQQFSGNKYGIQDEEVNRSKVNTIVLQSAMSSIVDDVPRQSIDGAGSLLKATLLGTDLPKDQNTDAKQPLSHEIKNVKNTVNLLNRPAAYNKPVPSSAVVAPPVDKNMYTPKPSDSVEDSSVNGDLTLKQLQHKIALMKARQSIALQVEREVLRAKNVKVVKEVLLPARTIKLTDTGTQTNLFSLVEPGRMVEMSINTSKHVESEVMVNAKGKPGPGDGTSLPVNTGTTPKLTAEVTRLAADPMAKTERKDSIEEPEKKRAKLEEKSETMSVDSDIDFSSVDATSSISKNINILGLSSSLGDKSNKVHIIGQPNRVRGPLVHHLSNKIRRPSEENSEKSIFDIIVQHNIANQSKQLVLNPPSGNLPMVYIPENNSVPSRKSNNKDTTKNINNSEPTTNVIQNLNQNVNIQETASKICELKRQAFKDWSQCLVPDMNGNIPLHRAVLMENLTLVKRQCVVLCARKASLDVPNNEKRTPLHLAVSFGNVDITKLLLSFGAQAKVKDSDGNTALHLAIKEGSLEMVNALLNSSNCAALPLDDFNDEGYAPMHLSALRGKVEETKALINKGADVNLKDARSGRTPLFHAVEAYNGDLVRLLLSSDANTNEANFSGHTPLSAASEISFSRLNIKEFDGINISSKLVSLKNGADYSQILEDGSSIMISSDILEDINMEDAPNNVRFASNNGTWRSND